MTADLVRLLEMLEFDTDLSKRDALILVRDQFATLTEAARNRLNPHERWLFERSVTHHKEVWVENKGELSQRLAQLQLEYKRASDTLLRHEIRLVERVSELERTVRGLDARLAAEVTAKEQAQAEAARLKRQLKEARSG